MRRFITVRTGGGPREIGYDVGRATGEIVRELVADNPRFYRKETGRPMDAIIRLVMRGYVPYARRAFPKYVEEVRGIAEGAGVRFEEAAVFSAEEEVLDLYAGWDKCTTAAVLARRGRFLIHSEDYIGRYYDKLIVIAAEPDGEPAHLSLAYPGTLAGSSCGLNAAGIAMAGNSLRFRPRRSGVPKNFILRKVLAARGLAEAGRAMRSRPRAVAGNATVLDGARGRAACFETTLDAFAEVPMGPGGTLCHTNHVISPAIDISDEHATWKSRLRLAALQHRLQGLGKNAAVPSLMKALSDREHGICYSTDRPERPCTLASVVMDSGRKTMYIANRSARGGAYAAYRLK